MTSEWEKLLIGSLDVNDGVNYVMEELTFKPAEPKPQWAENADADGAALVQEPHYTNAYFEAQIRIVPVANTDAALKALGTLIDALQECSHIEGGQEIPWTPNDSTRTYTWYALMGELQGVPITVTGDLAGWFLNSPVVKVKLTCRPFGYREEREVLAPVASSAPLQVVYVGGIEGDVPAEATLRVTDKALQDRRYLEWGQDLVASAEGNPVLELEAGSGLSVEGYAGTLATRSGSRSVKAAKVLLGQNPVTICSTGMIEHIGSFRLGLRCQCAEGAVFRATYRTGEGPWTTLPWTTGDGQNSSVGTDWRSIGLSEAFLEEVEQGKQVSEIRIQGKMAEGLAMQTAYVDLLDLFPAHRYGRSHGAIRLITPTSYSLSDPFNQSEGNATGANAEIGGPYAAITNSDTTDFTISAGRLRRSTVSDTGTIGTLAFTGRAIGPAAEFTNVAVSFDYELEAAVSIGNQGSRWGLLTSYVDNTHFVMVNFFLDYVYGPKISELKGVKLVVQRPDGTVLGTSPYLNIIQSGSVETNFLCKGSLWTVSHGAQLSVFSESEREPQRLVAQVENELIGIKGKTALFDQNAEAVSLNRTFDNLAIWVPEAPVVCRAGRSAEIRDNSEELEDAAGTSWSPIPEYRGSNFLLDPAGKQALVNRVAVRMRRNDITEEAEAALTDEQSLKVLARERFLAPR